MPARMLVTTWREQGPPGCARKLAYFPEQADIPTRPLLLAGS
jgi:hypothetical protein